MIKMMTVTPDFGKMVRKRLIELDWTTKDLAEQLHYSPSYINEILRGTRKAPRVRQMICQILDLACDDLLEIH